MKRRGLLHNKGFFHVGIYLFLLVGILFFCGNRFMVQADEIDSEEKYDVEIYEGKTVYFLEDFVDVETYVASASNKDTIWNFFKGKGFSDEGIAGIMGNLQAESGFAPNNLENAANNKSGYSDESFTAAVDNGSINRSSFISSKDFSLYSYTDSTGTYYTYGYGLAQWTFYSRKAALYDYWKSYGGSIGGLNMQLNFMYSEMSTKLKNYLTTATNVSDACVYFHNVYEGSADTAAQISGRVRNAENIYNEYHFPDVDDHTIDGTYSSYLPIHSFPIATGDIDVYDVNGKLYTNRHITGSTDECIIQEIYTDGWCKVKYPSSVESSGYFTAYVKISEFIPNANPASWTANVSTTAYKRSTGNETIGSVSSGDRGLKVASANGRTQVIYPVTNAGYYKMGWIIETNPGPDVVVSDYRLPCYTYAIGTGEIPVYDSNHNVYSKRYITGSTDECIIREIYSDGWCYISYPSTVESDGYFEAYVPLTTFVPNPNPVSWTAKSKYTAYRRSTGAETIGSVSAGDSCVAVSEENGRLQVMYPVTGTNYYKMGWIDASLSNNPQGVLDEYSAGIYSVKVRGWAFDRDDIGATLKIHVYVGGQYCGSLDANTSRPDVNDQHSCGDNHGFEGTISLDKKFAGTQTLEVYALNVGGGTNTLLKSVTVNIGSDTAAPSITNVKVSDISSLGYTVSCTVTDANGVDRVQFPTWTVNNEQDDIFESWETNRAASGTANGSTYTYRVQTSAHNNEGGTYITHIYAYDKYGNSVCVTVPEVKVPIEVANIAFSEDNITFYELGEKQTLTARIAPSDATDKTIIWSTSNSSVATVKDGVVTAVGNGTAIITAKAGNGVYATCEVTVTASLIKAEGTTGSLKWSLNNEGVLTISGTGKMKEYEGKTEMPWYSYLSEIKTVVIEDGATSIGAYAFYGMPNLTSITIPNSVTSIGEYAFKNSAKLNHVVLPAGLTKLGESAFYACTGLTSIDIPASLWTVQPYTFKNCTALAEVTFHEGNLEKISDAAFYNTALTKVELPDCLNILDAYVFKNCAKLAEVNLGTGITQIREASLYGTAISAINIPEGVTVIKPYAFKNCTKLKTVSLPETLISVDEAAFYACTALKEIILPDGVETIGNYAFRKCEGLANVKFGSGLKTIGESSFYGCESIVMLRIPDSVIMIKGYAFKGCINLDTITLSADLTTLGESAFYGCIALHEITIPANVSRIDEYAFSQCSSLKEVYFEGDAPVIGEGAFNRVTVTVYYPGDNVTWIDEVKKNYGGSVSWKTK